MTKYTKKHGVSPPKRPFSFFGIMIQRKILCGTSSQDLPPLTKLSSMVECVCFFFLFFLPIISIVKQHLRTGLSPQNIRHVPCLFTSISVL